MKFKKAIALALSAMMATTAIAIPVNASAAVTNKYEVQAAELDKLAYSGNDLGATYTPEATTFKVWAPTASAVSVVLYATGSKKESTAAGVDDALGTYEMTYDETNGVWSILLEGDFKDVYYQYSVKTGSANAVLTGDIYAKAVGIDGNRSMVVDLDSTDPQGWENDAYQLVPNQTDANIWEVHVKDFSYDASSGVSEANRGKYLAFTEKGTTVNGEGKISTCVDYLKDMGIKYVHINPFYDFGSVQETGPNTQFNWGYDPKNYNVP
ncbi:MAG: type I pullulanase, partial [Acutalibacteraceae bacterium]